VLGPSPVAQPSNLSSALRIVLQGIRSKIDLAPNRNPDKSSDPVGGSTRDRVFGGHMYLFFARLFVFLLLIGTSSFSVAADPPCAAVTRDRAKQLLTFHSGPDDRLTIDKAIKELPSMRNPSDPKQKFEVLEIWGYIYKGRYRMRFIYYNSKATSCLLMGEEILEYAPL